MGGNEQGFEIDFEEGLGDSIAIFLESGEWQRANPAQSVTSLTDFEPRGTIWEEAAGRLNFGVEGQKQIPERSTTENKAAAMEARGFIKDFVIGGFFEEDHSNLLRSEAEKVFLAHFKSVKSKRLKDISMQPNQNNQIQMMVVENISIKNIHEFAEIESDRYQRDMADFKRGSSQYRILEFHADYW